MDEYIKRETALKKIKELQETNPSTVGKKQFSEGYFCGLDEAEIVLLQTPIVDVVEVVRCKDCIHSRPLCHTEKKLYNDDCVGCTKISTSYHSVIMNDNCYCSYGERKIDNA